MEKLFDAEGMTRSERYFHTPSAFARKHLCYVQEVGQLKSLKPHVSSRENLESFLFFFVKGGSGSVSYEGKEYELKKGDAVLLDCAEHYEHKSSENDPWELAWIHFDGAKAEALYPQFKKQNEGSPCIRLAAQEQRAADLIGELLKMKGENSSLGEIFADTVVSRVLLLCMEQAGTKAAGTAERDFEGVREYLNTQIQSTSDDMETLKTSLEEKYNISFAEVSTAFEKRYGISLEDYAKNRMFNKAKELLRFTIKPVEEIVEESGIHNADIFRALFLENEEMSPVDYRKKWAQWIKG